MAVIDMVNAPVRWSDVIRRMVVIYLHVLLWAVYVGRHAISRCIVIVIGLKRAPSRQQDYARRSAQQCIECGVYYVGLAGTLYLMV